MLRMRVPQLSTRAYSRESFPVVGNWGETEPQAPTRPAEKPHRVEPKGAGVSDWESSLLFIFTRKIGAARSVDKVVVFLDD